MKTLIIYLGMAALGYAVAIPLRSSKEKLNWTGKVLTIVVMSLVFSMGFKIGSNRDVIANFGTIGVYSLIFAIVPLIVTVMVLHITRKVLRFSHQGIYLGKEAKDTETRQSLEKIETSYSQCVKNKSIFSYSTFRIGLAVLTGLILGYLIVIKYSFLAFDLTNKILGVYITYALYTMVFLVGIDMGFDGTAIQKFRQAGLRILVFPIVTGLATIGAVLACGCLMPLSLKEILGIGCTFCWYSLGPNIIMDAGYINAGAIAFLANFLRVIISLFTIPMVAKKVGYLETTGMPIAASMDVCIATIQGATNKETSMCAFVSGCVYTAAVPLLVPLIMS